MADIDVKQLIISIKKRPALYNKNNCMYYSNKKFKYKLWREVCVEVNRNWTEYTPQEKIDYARDLQKCWRTLRVRFDRELNLRVKEKVKTETSDEPAKKRRKYEHFNSLTFLVHPDKIKDYDISTDSDSETDQLVAQTQISVPERINSTSHYPPEPPACHSLEMRGYGQEVEPRVSFEEHLLELFKDYRKGEEDEDRQFLLSLCSVFRKMDSKKKMEARIEVLKLLQRMTYRFDDANNHYI